MDDFQLPKEYEVSKNGDTYEITISAVNPYWIGLCFILIATGLLYWSLPLFYSHKSFEDYFLYGLPFLLIGAVRLVWEKQKYILISVNYERFSIDGDTYYFSNINYIYNSHETNEFRVVRNTHQYSVKILIIEFLDESKIKIGKDLFDEDQIIIAHILNQFKRKNQLFVEANF